MASFNVPSGYVLLRDVFHKIAVSEALVALGDKYPPISEKTKEAISKYRKDIFKYERKLIWSYIAPPTNKPTRPICPPEVKDFINTLQGNGDCIERNEGAVEQLIKTEKLDTFAVQAGGLLRRLRPSEINFYTLSLEPGSLEPIVISEADVHTLINRDPQQDTPPQETRASNDGIGASDPPAEGEQDKEPPESMLKKMKDNRVKPDTQEKYINWWKAAQEIRDNKSFDREALARQVASQFEVNSVTVSRTMDRYFPGWSG